MGETAEALSPGPDAGGEDLAQIHPDDGALREGKEADEAYQQPDQEMLALSGGKDHGYAGQTNGGAGSAGEQQLLAAQAINHAHGDHGEEQVGGADGHRLEVARYFAVSDRTIYRLIDMGDLKVVRVRDCIRISAEEIREFEVRAKDDF